MNKFYVSEDTWIGVLNTGKLEMVSFSNKLYEPDSKRFTIGLSTVYRKLSKRDKARFMATLTYKEKEKYFEKIEEYVVK